MMRLLHIGQEDQEFVRKLGAIDRWSWQKSFGAMVVTGDQW